MRNQQSLIGRSVADLPSPSVLIDLHVVRRNVQTMAQLAENLGVALRPHWKTSKSAQAARLQWEAGAVGHTVATAAEASALAAAGCHDIFWAYPPVGHHRVQTALKLARQTRLILGPDSVASVRPLAEAAQRHELLIDVRLEVDSGLHRTGVSPENALATAKELMALPGIRLEGIFTHEGHVQGVGADPQRRRDTGVDAGRTLVEVAEQIRAAGIALESVSVGSTAGVRSAPTVDGITEARPGTYIYGDENQVAIGTTAPEDAAVTVLSRVISIERDGTVLIDAGIKAMSKDGTTHGDDRIGTVVSACGGIVAAGHEEHGFLRSSTGLKVGDTVRIRPNHACGLINMHSNALVIEDDIVTDIWPTLARH